MAYDSIYPSFRKLRLSPAGYLAMVIDLPSREEPGVETITVALDSQDAQHMILMLEEWARIDPQLRL